MALSRFAFVCLSLFAVGPVSAQTTLRYQLKQGEKLHYVVEQSTALQTQQGRMGIKASCEVAWEVGAADAAGKTKIALKVDRVQLDAQTPNGKLQIDSKDGKEPVGQVKEMLGDLYAGLKEAEITMSMDARGNVSDLHLPKALVAAARKMAGGPGLAEAFTEDGLKRLFGLSGQALPEGSVMKDQSWDHTQTIKFRGGNLVQDTKSTYQGPIERDGKKLEKIGLKPTLKLDGGRVTTRITIKQMDAHGTAYFDNAAGRLVEASLEQKGEIEVGVPGSQPPRNVETTMSWKLMDKER